MFHNLTAEFVQWTHEPIVQPVHASSSSQPTSYQMAIHKTAQPLHTESIKYLKILAELKVKRFDEIPLEAARETSRKVNKLAAGEVNYDGKRTELFVPSPEVPAGIPVYVYVPTSHKPNPPILLYFHGGGYIVGDRMSVDSCCKLISSGASCIVVNVEYRLAPENAFPAFINDSCLVAEWTLKNKEKIGGSPLSKVGVSGGSAGGQLSATIAHDVPGIAFQVLICPHLSARGDRSLVSFQEYKDVPGLDFKLIDWYENLVAPISEWRNPRFANLLRDKFDHLPPCLFIVAECDPLRDDSYEYSKKLNAAGVPNELLLVKGALHQFFTLPATFPECTHKAYTHVISFICKYGTA